MLVWQYVRSVVGNPMSQIFRLRIAIIILVLSCFSQAQSSARLMVTAQVACSVSAQIGEKGKVTIVTANCSNAPQAKQKLTVLNSQPGLTIEMAEPQPAITISVETRSVLVRNRLGQMERRTIETTTIVPQ